MQNVLDNSYNSYYTTKRIEAWLSLVERCVRDAEVASSNLVASTFPRPVGQAVKTTPSHGVNPGSIPGQVICCCISNVQQHFLQNASVAQSVEQRIRNAWVGGSSPPGSLKSCHFDD